MAKLIKYNPDSKIWSGHVSIDVPDYGERRSLIAEFGRNEGDIAKIVERSHELAIKHTKECKLKHIETGYEFNDLEELKDSEEGGEVLQQIGICIAKGPKLGKIIRET